MRNWNMKTRPGRARRIRMVHLQRLRHSTVTELGYATPPRSRHATIFEDRLNLNPFWRTFRGGLFCGASLLQSIFTKPLFPSLHAYSNIGPSVWFRGTIADQGFVHVVGSSIVNLYSIILESRRVKRSVMRKVLGLAPRKVAPGRKLVVCTTSVLPSQCPRESPCHRWTFCERCGRPSKGDDANFAVPLVFDHHVACALHDAHSCCCCKRQEGLAVRQRKGIEHPEPNPPGHRHARLLLAPRPPQLSSSLLWPSALLA